MQVFIKAETTEGLIEQAAEIEILPGEDLESSVANYVYAMLSFDFIKEIRIVRD